MFCNLIEDILPLNYYSEMCGIIVDMTIIKALVIKYFPNLEPIFEEKEENCGEYICDNFINRGLTNLFTNDMLDEKTSLLIWDLIFLEGNVIILKSFISIYCCVRQKLVSVPKNIENFQIIINEDIKRIGPESYDLIHGLVIKQYEFSEEFLNTARFGLSVQVAETLESDAIEVIKSKIKTNNKNIEINHATKYKKCNRKWPYCLNDAYFENVDQVLWYVVFNQKNEEPLIANYFFEGTKREKISETNRENKEEMNIIVERRMHYCEDEINNAGEDNLSSNFLPSESSTSAEINSPHISQYNHSIYSEIIHQPGWVKATEKFLGNFEVEKPFFSEKIKESNKLNNKGKSMDNNEGLLINDNCVHKNIEINVENNIIDKRK